MPMNKGADQTEQIGLHVCCLLICIHRYSLELDICLVFDTSNPLLPWGVYVSTDT